METKKIKRYAVLGILFFLPVVFLIMLIPAKHNYTTLDIVNSDVRELQYSSSETEEIIKLKDHITVLGFLGKDPIENLIATSNLKELVYDKFKGFKKFQIVMISQEGTDDAIEQLKREIVDYNTLDYFHFVQANPADILSTFNSLKSKMALDTKLATPEVFIIDKELNQRGRIEDPDLKRTKTDNVDFSLPSYNTIEVAEIKNKMSEDMRVLFTEYRQKRKGDFNSTIRRAEDIGEKK